MSIEDTRLISMRCIKIGQKKLDVGTHLCCKNITEHLHTNKNVSMEDIRQSTGDYFSWKT